MAERPDIAQRKKFQSWHLEPKGRIVGDWPLPDALEPSQYVELCYAADGQLLLIREHIEGQDAPLLRRPAFDGGHLRRSDYKDPGTGLEGRNSYEYDARGLLCRRQETTPKGALRFMIEVQCDASGRIVRQRLHDQKKRFKERIDYAYDAKGRRVKESFFRDADGQQPSGHVEKRYDDRDRVTRQSWFDASGALVNTFLYAYDALDRVVELAIERAGQKTLASAYTFDAKGRRIRTVLTDAEGAELAREEREGRSFPGYAARGEGALSRERGLAELAGVDTAKLDEVVHVAYFFFEKGQLERARELFELLANLRPEDAYAATGVAACALAQEKHQTALNWYERALHRDPAFVQALAGKAETLLLLHRVDEALGTFGHLFELAPPGSSDPAVARARAILSGLQAAMPAARGS